MIRWSPKIRDNGKENGNYRDYIGDYIGIIGYIYLFGGSPVRIIIRIFWGPYWGPLFWGNYQFGIAQRSRAPYKDWALESNKGENWSL